MTLSHTFFLLLLGLSNISGGVSVEEVNETTPIWTTPTTGDYSTIFCDYFPDPSEVDEGNYGDGLCLIDGNYSNEKLLLRKFLTTNDGETFFGDSYNFPSTVVTSVSLLNFGRYHGATNAIDISNEAGNGSVEIYVDIFSGRGIRMFLEIYGF